MPVAAHGDSSGMFLGCNKLTVCDVWTAKLC